MFRPQGRSSDRVPRPGGGTGEALKADDEGVGDDGEAEPDRVRPCLAAGDPFQPDAMLELLNHVLGLPTLVVPVQDVLRGFLLRGPVGGDDVGDAGRLGAAWERQLPTDLPLADQFV